MGTSRFARATAVAAAGPGRYRAELGPEWNCPIVPQGGMVVATAARAMEAAIADDALRPRSLSVVFAGQVQSGAVEIDVEVLRRGRSMSQCAATVRNPGAAAGTTGIAVFGASRRGYSFTDATPPEVPSPRDCPSFRDPPPVEFDRGDPFPFWENVEGRPAAGNAPWDEWEPTTSMTARWYRFDEPARLDDGRWDPLAVIALADTMPSAVYQRLGPGWHDTFAPSADFTAHLLNDAYGEWILAVNRARFAGDGYASADMEMWDMEPAEPVLVAYATQTMFFTVLDR